VLEIRQNMRVPENSILAHAFRSTTDVTLSAVEDQHLWETSADGHLKHASIRIEAIRRSRFVYGLIIPASTPREKANN
jgi:hypothetical protein